MKNILKSISMMIYAMIVFILIAVFVNSKSRIAEFDKMIDIFESFVTPELSHPTTF